MRIINKKLQEELSTALKKIEVLEALIKRQDEETGFMRPRLVQARRIFESSRASFCSWCMTLCTITDQLKCGHYLCLHCRATDLSCKLCNSKEKYGMNLI